MACKVEEKKVFNMKYFLRKIEIVGWYSCPKKNNIYRQLLKLGWLSMEITQKNTCRTTLQ